MDINEHEGKIRGIRNKVQENGDVMNRIVDSLVSKYNRDLHELIETLKENLKSPERIEDQELEEMVLKIPVYMYFGSTGLETLGIEGDSAKAIKMEVFNEAYMQAEGTINDKTSAAQNQTFSEHLVEVAFSRAYKKLKVQIEMAEHVYSGVKKVLQKRMDEYVINGRDKGMYYSKEEKGERESF